MMDKNVFIIDNANRHVPAFFLKKYDYKELS